MVFQRTYYCSLHLTEEKAVFEVGAIILLVLQMRKLSTKKHSTKTSKVILTNNWWDGKLDILPPESIAA
jgi:hypothetical protein